MKVLLHARNLYQARSEILLATDFGKTY